MRSPDSEMAIAVTVILAAIAIGTFGWRRSLLRANHQEQTLGAEPWEHVQEEYPLAQAIAEPARLSPESVEAVVRANPFSSKRRSWLQENGAEPEPEAAEAPAARFIFKGRIHLGKRQRAVVEETTTHKTYFLEVGQEVAGFKVLDIAENQVVLSDLQTHEEISVSLLSADRP